MLNGLLCVALVLAALTVESDSFACSMGFCVCFKRIDQAYYRAADKTFSNYVYQKGSTWVNVILKQVVVPAYWGGLTHFQKCNDSLSDLVVKTGYYQVFTDFASCIAPDEETRQLMMTALLVERTKIDEQWIEKVSECSEGGQLALAKTKDSAFDFTRSTFDTYLCIHAVEPPRLDPEACFSSKACLRCCCAAGV